MSAYILIHLLLATVPVSGSVHPAPPETAQLRPDTVLSPPAGPTIALFESGSTEVVSIRASVPLVERPEEAGAGQILRIQARQRMSGLAERVGARVDVHRTPATLVYQVSGPTQDLDFLAWILREGMAAPDRNRLDAARDEARLALERRLETPEGALGLRLRRALAPGAVPYTGTLSSLERLDGSRVSAVWARSHHRPDVRVVVAGRIEPTLVLAALADLGLPESAPQPQTPPGDPPAMTQPDPEVIRHWVARAFPVDEGSGAAVLVAARHLTGVLQEEPGDYETAVEIWEPGPGQALVISGAAYPRAQQAMRERISGLLAEALRNLDSSRVEELAAALRAELRYTARTPWGLADLVGQGWDASGDPDGAERLMSQLTRVRADDIRDLLEALAAGPTVEEEIRP